MSCTVAVHKSNDFWNKTKIPLVVLYTGNLKHIPDGSSLKSSQRTCVGLFLILLAFFSVLGRTRDLCVLPIIL